MKIVVTGSRYKKVVADTLKALADGQKISEMELIHGACLDSFDILCAEFATNAGWKVTPMPAQWNRYRNRAGSIRNGEMLNLEPDYVASFNLGTNGTNDCVWRAKKKGLVVIENGHIVEYD